MKNLIFILLFFVAHLSFAQFREHPQTIKYEIPKVSSDLPASSSFLGMLSDPPQTYKFQSPTPSSSYNLNGRDQYQTSWIGSVTSQSYGNGKFGTYYYWDVQGNLQGTRGFIDIAGKNKRGWKLLFPWR